MSNFRRHTDADTFLLDCYLTIRQEEDGDDIPDVSFDPIGLTTHGVQDFRPFFTQSVDDFGAGCYGSEPSSRIRRGRIMVASAATTLASRKELHLSPLKVVTTLGGMGTIRNLLDNGVDLGPLRNGLPTKITDALVEALKRDGFIPVTRKSGKNKVFDGCIPVDAKADHVVKALAKWSAGTAQFQGYLGSDPTTGRERTKTEVCEHFVGIVTKAAEKRARAAAKRAENAAAKKAEAEAEAVEAAADAPSVTSEGAEEAPAVKVEETAPSGVFGLFSEEQQERIQMAAKANNLDVSDDAALLEFLATCVELATAPVAEETVDARAS